MSTRNIHPIRNANHPREITDTASKSAFTCALLAIALTIVSALRRNPVTQQNTREHWSPRPEDNPAPPRPFMGISAKELRSSAQRSERTGEAWSPRPEDNPAPLRYRPKRKAR